MDDLWSNLGPVTATKVNTTCSECSLPVVIDTEALTLTATIPSNGQRGSGHVPAHEVQVDIGSDGDLAYWECPRCGYADSTYVDDETRQALSSTGAASKRPSMADAPTKQPMKAGIKPAQRKSPSSDQKKFRRGMNKKAAEDSAVVDTCPQCGSDDIRLYDNFRHCNACGFEFNDDGTEYTFGGLGPHPTTTSSQTSRTPTKESTMTAQPTEADLLARLAAAPTLIEQSALAAQLDDLRAAKRDAASVEASLDWGAMDTPTQYEGSAFSSLASLGTGDVLDPDVVSEHIANHRTSADSDWLLAMEAPIPDDTTMTTQMRAQATQWYEHEVWAPVKESAQEFSVQAHNAALRAGSEYGLRTEAAASVFLAQVIHLHKAAGYMARTAEWGKDPYEQPDGQTTDTYVTDGKTTTPVGVDPKDADTFDENTLGPNGVDDGDGDSDDPKTGTGTGDAPSLSEGTSPESDKAEGVENPLTGQESDASTFDTGAPTDRMKTQTSKTAISLTNVGIEGDNGVGTDPNGNRVKFRLSEKDKADLSAVLYSDLAVNFTGVDVEESDLIKEGSLNPNVDYAAEFALRPTGGLQPREGGFFNKKPTSGPLGDRSEWERLRAQQRSLREKEHQQTNDRASDADDHGTGVTQEELDYATRNRRASLFSSLRESEAGEQRFCPRCKDGFMQPVGDPFSDGDTGLQCTHCGHFLYESDFAKASGLHTAGDSTSADGQGSEWGLGAGIDEGDAPEGDHAESPVQEPGQGAADKSQDRWVDNLGTGGTGDATSGAAPGTPYHSSLSANAKVFLQTLSRMSSLDQQVAGVSGHQIVALLNADPTVPEQVKRSLASGVVPPFGREAAETCPGSGARMKDQGERSTDAKFFGYALGKCPVCGKTVRSKSSTTPQHSAESKTGARRVQASDPDWLRERVNDPYGTPNKAYNKETGEYYDNPFWVENPPEMINGFKVISKDGRWFAYHPTKNYWMKLNATSAEAARAEVEGMNSSLDMWASRTAAFTQFCKTCNAGIVGGSETGWHHAGPDGPAEDKDHTPEPGGVGYSPKQSSRDTGTCAECGRAVSYDSSTRSWSHDNEGPDTQHAVRPVKASAKTAATDWKVGDIIQSRSNGHTYEIVRITPAGANGTKVSDGPVYHATITDDSGHARPGGYTADIWDGSMSNPTSAFQKTDPWGGKKDLNGDSYAENNRKFQERNSLLQVADAVIRSTAAEQWWITRDGERKYGPFDDENAAFAKLLRVQPMSTDWAIKYEGWNIEKSAARMADRRHPSDTFSISDAKNEDGEWTMSPEQIRSEMAYDDEDPFYAEVDDEGYRLHGSRRHAADAEGWVYSPQPPSFVLWAMDLNSGGYAQVFTDYSGGQYHWTVGRSEMTQGEDDRGEDVASGTAATLDEAKAQAKQALDEAFPSRGGGTRIIQNGVLAAIAANLPKVAMPNPAEHGIEVGSIFYSSWGYDQTNIDFYEVTGMTGASVRLRQIASKVVDSNGHQDYLMPVKGQFVGAEFLKRLQVYGNPVVSLNSYSNAYLWDGKPKAQTGYGFGH